jgi:hypothetical protein
VPVVDDAPSSDVKEHLVNLVMPLAFRVTRSLRPPKPMMAVAIRRWQDSSQ